MSPRLRRLTGHLLLGVFFATFAASLTAGHLTGQDDELCVVTERGNSPATLTSRAVTDTPDHCGLCHWVRAVASAASYGPAATLPLVIEPSADAPFVASGPRDSVDLLNSSRAPPAFSLS